MKQRITIFLIIPAVLLLTGCTREGVVNIEDCREVITIKEGSIRTYLNTFTCSLEKTDDGDVMSGVCSSVKTSLFGDKCKKAYVYEKKPTKDCGQNAHLEKKGCFCDDGFVYVKQRQACLNLFLHETKTTPIEIQTNKNELEDRIVDIAYPKFKELGSSQNQNTLNSLIEEFVINTTKEIEKDFDQPDEYSKNEIDINYEIVYQSNDFVSVKFVTNYYFPGTVHENYYPTVINFDLNNNQVVQLSNLFLDQSEYLQDISSYTKSHLIYDEWSENGLEPTTENYSVFSIGENGITFYFRPYQAGSFAEGIKTILVPYNFLSQYMSPDFLAVFK